MDYLDVSDLGGRQRVFRARFKLDAPGYYSHITQRAAGKEPLFLENSDYLTLLGILKEATEKFDVRMHALCLMPNHVHLLLRPEEKNLAEAMRSIFSRYAMKFNRKYERRGHLFGGPYRQAVCLDSTYLLTASLYIHLNPVRAGMVQQPSSYRWSSCTLYTQTGGEGSDSFIDPEPILTSIHPRSAEARKEYEKLLLRGRELQPDNALEQEGAIESFCSKLASVFPALFRRVAGKDKLGQPAVDFELLDVTRLEQRLEDIKHMRSQRPETMRARKYLVQQLLARGYKKTEIAERLGVSRQTIYDTLDT